MDSSNDPRTRAIHDLANRLVALAAHLESIAKLDDPRASKPAAAALEELASARVILKLLAGTVGGDVGAADLDLLMRQATSAGARVRRGVVSGSAKIELGAAAVHAVLESVLRCERSNSPTVSAVAVGGRARVTVESAAEPFSATERERLLDPMRLRNPAELGGGLAFAACAEIVHRAGGEFTLGGADRRSYSIELPLARASASPQPRAILVVDDEDSVRQSIAMLLRHLGHRAEVAGDLATASEAIRRGSVDGVVVDVHLGNGSEGEDLVRSIAAHHPGLLARTAISTGDPTGAEIAERLGVRLLAKPFGIEELRSLFG